MKSVEQSLLPKLAQVKKYLEVRVEQEIVYQELITQIDNTIAELVQHKSRIKLVSDEIDLSRRLKNISINDLDLNRHYQFHVVPIDGLLENIIQDCEMILIVYPHRAINHWIEIQNNDFNANILWSKDSPFILDSPKFLQRYQHYVKQNSCFINAKLQEKYTAKITRIVSHQIEKLNKATWQAMQAQQNQWLAGKSPEAFRQRFHNLIAQINKLLQQKFQRIKQTTQQNKSYLNNPFVDNNLFWQTQKIIQASEVNIVKVEQQDYLIGMVKTKDSLEPLHRNLSHLYQQQFQAQIEKQWEKCQYSYGDGGLSQLRQDIKAKLKLINHFEEVEITALSLKNPNFDLKNLFYLPILAECNRIPFEYSFNQSQWFKILVAGGVGVAIFLVTQLFSGQGRFFGFFILIFQFINLFTGQDIKTLKLKQQTKELKRKLDNKYQILIRLSADKITQDLIVALDSEQQHYQQQIDAISQTANEQISAIKNQIKSQKEQINNRKQDLEKILQLLE